MLIVVGAVLLAALLELSLRLTPEYDPYGWLIWGRQTAHLALDPAGAPSWKPLPWLITTPLSLAGGAAPTLWLIVACAGGLAGLVLAFRLAHALGGVAAGVVAVVGLVLCRDWVSLLVTGAIEPITVALMLGAAECHLAGRRRAAAVLLVLVTLARPEGALLLAAYGLWLWRVDTGARRWLLVGASVVIALWLLPPFISLGHVVSASDPVFQSGGGASHNPVIVAYRGATIVIWPVAVLAVAGLALSRWLSGAGSSATIGLTAAGLAWLAATALMAIVGFPGIRRFMLPAAAIACVLAGAGVSLIWTRVVDLGGYRRTAVAGLAILTALAAFGWYGSFRVSDAITSVRQERARSTIVRSLHQAIERAGGARFLLACGSPSARFGLQSTIAWDLGVPVGVVGYRPHHDLGRRPHVILFSQGGHGRLSRHERLLASAGPWRVIGVRATCATVHSAA